MIFGFTRKDMLEITGLSPGSLYYLQACGLVFPQEGSGGVFAAESILEILVIEHLKKVFSFKHKTRYIFPVVKHLRKFSYDPALFRMNIVLCRGRIYWEDASDESQECSVSERIFDILEPEEKRMYLMRIPLGNVTADLWQRADGFKDVFDFHKRIKGTALAKIRKSFQSECLIT